MSTDEAEGGRAGEEADRHSLSDDSSESTRMIGAQPSQYEPSSEHRLQSANVAEARQQASQGATDLPRSITFVHGLALVIGLQIGSGIFSSPAAVRSSVSSTAQAMLAWILGAVIAATGAASFSIIGKLVPLNGGIQEYLRFLWGDLFGFIFAWVWIFLSRPLALAMVSMIFSEYLFRAILTELPTSVWAFKACAIAAVVAITWLNCLGTRIGTGLGNVFLFLKVFGLGSIAVVGIPASFFLSRSTSPSALEYTGTNGTMSAIRRGETSSESLTTWEALRGFVDAVLTTAFAYGGWESLSFVAGEIADVETTLPRALKVSMTFTITLFLTSTFALYLVVPVEKLRETNTPALDFGHAVAGRLGAIFYAWVVCLCCMGSLNSIVFSTSRLTQAAGDRQYLPPILKASSNTADSTGHRWQLPAYLSRYMPVLNPSDSDAPRDNIPRNAMVLNCLLAAIYVLVGSFRGLVIIKGMAEYIVYFFTVLGLLIYHIGWFQSDDRNVGISHTTMLYSAVFCFLAGSIVLETTITHLRDTALIFVFLMICTTLYYRGHWSKHVSAR